MRNIISRLQLSAKNVLDPLLRRYRHAALLDFPNYPNVGDSAIWHGERSCLRDIGLEVRYTADSIGYREEDLRHSIGASGVVLIQGGGNFGNLYPHHQEFRERLFRTLRDIPIIQLPQTIRYTDQHALEQAKQAISDHPNLTILCRDIRSLEFSRSEFNCGSQLCPDLAFFLGSLSRNTDPNVDLFCLLRTDRERQGPTVLVDNVDTVTETADWLDENPLLSKIRHCTSGLQKRVGWFPGTSSTFLRLADRVAWHRVVFGTALLSRGRVVITDRLHGHILCLLLNIPHVIVDSGYGKLRGFSETFGTTSAQVHFADHANALTVARKLLDHEQFHHSTYLPQR